MKKYQSHKIVEAMKIESMEINPDLSATFYGPDDEEVTVSLGYQQKHNAFAHGYYVRYEDGYESWSPTAAFKNGYAPLDETESLFNPLVSDLLALLDQIEVSDESDYATSRFDILKKYGITADFYHEGSAAEH